MNHKKCRENSNYSECQCKIAIYIKVTELMVPNSCSILGHVLFAFCVRIITDTKRNPQNCVLTRLTSVLLPW